MNSAPEVPADAIRQASDLAAPRDPILVRLHDYWQGKRGDRLMPSRADIDPAELRTLVHYVSLYDVGGPGEPFRVRLVGRAIEEFVGKNYTGLSVTAGMPPEAAKRMVEILGSVVAARTPRFRTGYAYWHKDRSYRHFEACFLPLSPDGRTVNMIFAGITFATEEN